MRMPKPESRLPELVFALIVALPLTVYLAAPPMWSSSLAQTECEELVVTRLDGAVTSAKASWDYLPIARWDCTVDGRRVADFGWWVTQNSSVDAKLLVAE
jgi:hypothetical protein